jgi:hypothetical protein
MDDVADALDDVKDPEARLALSYGELLSQAIQQRQLAADAQAVAEVAAENQPAAAAAAAEEEDAGALTAEAAMESILAALPEPAVLVPLPAAVPAVAVQRQEQEEVDDFLASVLASPSPQDAAQLPAVPEGPAVATAAAALGAAAPEAAAAAEPATEPAAAAGAGVGAENSAASAEREGSGSPPPEPVLPMTAEQRRLLHWHWANLEYGCSARLEEVRHAVLRCAAHALLRSMLPASQLLLPAPAAAFPSHPPHSFAQLTGCRRNPPCPCPALPYAALLLQISAPHWNQDEDSGGFGGAHCMVVGGYDAAFKALAATLGDSLHLNTPVVEVGHRASLLLLLPLLLPLLLLLPLPFAQPPSLPVVLGCAHPTTQPAHFVPAASPSVAHMQLCPATALWYCCRFVMRVRVP